MQSSFGHTVLHLLTWYLVLVIKGPCVIVQLAPSLAGQQVRRGFSTRGAS